MLESKTGHPHRLELRSGSLQLLRSVIKLFKLGRLEIVCAQSEDDLRFNGGSSVLPGLSVGGMVWQRLSFATAASDMGTKRDLT